MSAATRLKQLVDGRGIRYTFIADKTGIPLNSISRTFLGKRKLTADEMFSICEATGIEPTQIGRFFCSLFSLVRAVGERKKNHDSMKGGESVYQNLKAEMARQNLTKRDLARGLNTAERNIRNRFNGKTPFSIPEAFAIRDKFFPGISLDYLFQRDAATPSG